MTFKIDYPNILPDFVTSRNFLFFIISKEYVDYSSNIKCFNELIDEDTKFKFYQFLFRATKDPLLDIFQYIKEVDNPFKKKINSLVTKRIETLLGSLNETLSYTEVIDLVNSVLSSLHERADVIGPESKGRVCKYSLIGSFMRKFCVTFQALQVAQVAAFLGGFRQLMDAHGLIATCPGPAIRATTTALELKATRLSEDQARWGLQQLERGLEDVLYSGTGPGTDSDCRARLARIERQYPGLPDPPLLAARLANDAQSMERACLQQLPGNGVSNSASGGGGGSSGGGRDPPHARRRDHVSTTGAGTGSGPQDPLGGGPTAVASGTGGTSKQTVLIRNSEIRAQLSEASLHCVVALSQLGCQQEALEHYRDAVFNAKMSRRADLIAEVGSAGNALMPINENPTGTAYSRITDANMDDQTALGQIRDSLLYSLHNDQHSLAELLRKYFSSSGPQRRALTPICLIYLSMIFRSFGFQGMANCYMLIAGCLESIERTKSHREVLVELVSQLIGIHSSAGQFQRAQSLLDRLDGPLDGQRRHGVCQHPAVRASLLRGRISHQLARQDEAGALRSLNRLRLVSLGEWALLRVHTLFALEHNMEAANQLGNHVVALAQQRRHQLVHAARTVLVAGESSIGVGRDYGQHASKRRQDSTANSSNRTAPPVVTDHLSETRLVSTLPDIDDCVTQNWGARDWALYECRARWLLATQLMIHLQFPVCHAHLKVMRDLASKFLFYQFLRLCDVLELALRARESEASGRPVLESPLADVGSASSGSGNLERSRSALSSRLGLGPRSHALFLNILLGLFVSKASRVAIDAGHPTRRNAFVEQHLSELADFYSASGDCAGQAHCWTLIARYSDAIGNQDQKRRADLELDMLLENKLASVPSPDFLAHVL